MTITDAPPPTPAFTLLGTAFVGIIPLRAAVALTHLIERMTNGRALILIAFVVLGWRGK